MKKFDKLFKSRSSRALLFFGTLIVALIVAYIMLSFGGCSAKEVISFFPVYPWLFKNNDSLAFYLICTPLGWIVYIVIILSGVLSKSLGTSQILFFVFLFLLLLGLLFPSLNLFGVFGKSWC